MADTGGSVDLSHPILNLTPEEKRVFGQLFAQADTEKLGVVTGEVAVKFFERTKLAPSVLGEIWQIADTENRGLLTSSGFCIVLRLIGHYQTGREPTPELAFRPGPLPKFEGLNIASGPPPSAVPPAARIQPQPSGGPIRVPPLTPDKAAEYAALFDKSGAQDGDLSGETAKQIFERVGLPNEILGRIWNLADTEQRGKLSATEFVIAMHLLASYKSGAMTALPSSLPAGLYEAAARRGPPPSVRQAVGARPLEPAAMVRQFSGHGVQRTQSPIARPPYGTPPQSAHPTGPSQATGNDWLISPQEKASYDALFNKVDTQGRGFITGEQAVLFFSDSGLSEDILASIWDLADINSEGQLNRDEFAVAMYLIRQQRGKPGSVLPATLPLNLVPPSMRSQARPVSHTTAPTFDNAAHSSNMPKSASEDLFGLDAFSSPAPIQTQQSTGGSTTYNRTFDTDPFGSKAATPTTPQGFQPSPRNPASTFKPFIPASNFGQTLTSQSTGTSGTSPMPQDRQAPQPSAMDDLLGDNDPEISKKLTQETTELANMSNQIGTLRNQMQEVQNKKAATENDLSSTSTQKRDLELRLSHFRTQYEQEVKQVKELEERLANSRTDTRELQQELAMFEGTYQDLQNQHRQVGSALEADQRENNTLRERIRQINAEVNQLRPQLDKMRSDARQQKGMVAINKKQLATTEGERDKIKSEMSDLSKAAQESSKNAQTTAQEPGSAVVSPAASTISSTNPFFRKSSQSRPAYDNISPSGFTRGGDSTQAQDKYDNIFGPSYSSPQATSPPPQTSFRTESNVPAASMQSGPSARSSEPDVPTPSTSSPLSSHRESPHTAEAPASSESRQTTSRELPSGDPAPRTESLSSSVRESTPASKYGLGGNETHTNVDSSLPAPQEQEASQSAERTDTSRAETSGGFGPSSFDRDSTASPATSVASDARPAPKIDDRRDAFQNFRQFSATTVAKDIPGAFPDDSGSAIQPNSTDDSTLSDRSKGSTRPSEGFSSGRSDPFSMKRDQPRGPQATKIDFDSAFANFRGGQQPQERQNTESSANGSVSSAAANKFNKEFPPIEDIENDDDDSDTSGERTFDDNFTSPSPQHNREVSTNQDQTQSRSTIRGNAGDDDFFQSRPMSTQAASNVSELPTPNAQKSPPSYGETMSTTRSGGRDSNQFPPEFTGLLPSRQDPTSPPHSQSPEGPFTSQVAGGQGEAIFGSSGSSQPATTAPATASSASSPPADHTASSTLPNAYHSAMSYITGADKEQPPAAQPPQASKPSFSDDFDSGFDDLSEAKEVDDKGDDGFMFSSQHREGLDEFNPVFDSPVASKSNTMASQQTPTGKPSYGGDDSFSDFEQHMSQSFGQGKAPQQPATTTTHDWDAIFSGLDQPQADKVGESSSRSPFPGPSEKTYGRNEPSFSSYEPAASSSSQPAMPQLGRALSSGTEHDDPILKKLTGMGYPRSEALAALEKFDYDINKAADHLTSGQ